MMSGPSSVMRRAVTRTGCSSQPARRRIDRPMARRHGAAVLLGLATLFLSCSGDVMTAYAGPQRISYSEFEGCGTDDQSLTLDAYKRSCARILKLSRPAPFDTKGGDPLYGR